MITIFSDAARLPISYNGYALNSVSAVESGAQGTEVWGIAYSSPIDSITEKLQWDDGIQVEGVTRSSRLIQMSGVIRGSSRADLNDRIRAFSHAFDPGWVAFVARNAGTDPFLPLTFDVPGTSGTVPSKVMVLPTETPMPSTTSPQSRDARFRLTLLAKEPRRLAQAPVSLTNAGTLSNPAADTWSRPTLTFTMAGAGNPAFTISCTATVQGSKSLVLDLSGRSNGQAVTVDFASRRVLVDGTPTAGIYVSGDWFVIEPGDNVVSYSNVGNSGTKVMTAYPAWSF